MIVFRKQILLYLAEQESATLRQISTDLKLRPTTCWEYLLDMETQGIELVERINIGYFDELVESPEDVMREKGRYYKWKLSEKGKELVASLKK